MNRDFSKMYKPLWVSGPTGPFCTASQSMNTDQGAYTEAGTHWGFVDCIVGRHTCHWSVCSLHGRHCTEKKVYFMSSVSKHLLCIHYSHRIECT